MDSLTLTEHLQAVQVALENNTDSPTRIAEAVALLIPQVEELLTQRQQLAEAVLSLPDTNGYGERCHHCQAETFNYTQVLAHEEGCIVLLAESIVEQGKG